MNYSIYDKDIYIDYSNKNLITEIGTFKFMEELSIIYTELQDIPLNITKIKTLQKLQIFSNKNIDFFNLKYLKNLKTLILNCNFPIEIKYLSNLEELRYSNINYNLYEIPTSIISLRNLKILKITSNNITSIPDEIINLVNLEKIILYNNKIELISSNIQYLKNLIQLDLSENKLKILQDEIKFLSNLEIFNVSNNNILFIPEWIIYLHNLKELNFNKNPIENISNKLKKIIKFENKKIEKTFLINYDILNSFTDIPTDINYDILENILTIEI